ncbi:response regulator transcription factor [Granulosicoccaceae sp. 1_MG-2023]|nr:response regulator transcription factor [Granulosicoccaceae sp. 1_MG-2023]
MGDGQMLRVVVLEDESDQAERMSSWIVNAGHHCEVFATIGAFKDAFRKAPVDVIALDWGLQDGTGLEVLKWLRRDASCDVPVIFVTAREAEEDIVTALEAGADDYLVKPVREKEVLARLKALARRAQPESELLEFEPYIFDTGNRQVRYQGQPVRLTEKEYELALFMFRNRGRVLSRQQLLSNVWGTSAELNTRTVDTHASRLRKKLQLSSSGRWKLTSIYQHGYRLDEYVSH